MYKVHGMCFSTFEEVIEWAFNTLKVDLWITDPSKPLTEKDKQDLCNDLAAYIDGLDQRALEDQLQNDVDTMSITYH